MLSDTTSRPVPRPTMVLAAFTGLTAALLAWFGSPVPQPLFTSSGAGSGSAGDWTWTSDGPVGPDDRALLVSLRQDDLWEVPVGEQAQQMAVDQAVRRLGGTVATDLGWLGGQVRAVADRLDVVPPSQPTPDQQSWLVGIAGTSGPDYDHALVTRLRRAGATTLATLAQAEATTGNEQIRQLTDQATPLVTRHLRSLDGLAATPALAPEPRATGGSPLLITGVVLLGLFVLVGALSLTGLVRSVWPTSGCRHRWPRPAPAGRTGPARRPQALLRIPFPRTRWPVPRHRPPSFPAPDDETRPPMIRVGRHRTPRPTRLLVLTVALLVGADVALATGTATAHGAGGPTGLALANDPLGVQKSQNGDGQDGRNGDGQDGAGQRGQNGDAQRRENDQGNQNGPERGKGFGNRFLDGTRNRFSGNKQNQDDRNNNDRKDDDRNNNDRNKDNDRKDNGQNKDDDEEFPGRDKAAPASDDDFVDIREVQVDDQPRDTADASTGSFVAHCGTNANNHRNSDNFMVTPGKRNGAQHVHDYVGNLSTDANSTDDSLHAAGTTCDRDNKSTFFWPVVRNTAAQGGDTEGDGGGLDGNVGQILRERTADIRFLGNPTSKVEPMPDDLQFIMGDAKAVTNGPENAHAQWSCTGFENRHIDKYPLCPAGSRLVRKLEFPSCWDGKNLDSADHRSHVVFPDDDGACDSDHTPIPKLVVTLTYDRPHGRDFAVDTFPDQRHNPATDHSDFMNIVPANLPDLEADCINSGRTC